MKKSFYINILESRIHLCDNMAILETVAGCSWKLSLVVPGNCRWRFHEILNSAC